MPRKKIVEATFLPAIDYGNILYMHAAATTEQGLDSVYQASICFMTKPVSYHCIIYDLVGWTSLTTLNDVRNDHPGGFFLMYHGF